MMRSLSQTLAVAAALSAPALAADLTIEPITPSVDAPITARWVKDGDSSWYSADPTFTLGKPTDTPSAQGWIATNNQGVLLHVVVKDAKHVNTRTGSDIWDGDALQLGFDATATGVGALDKGAERVTGTISALACALGANGPETFAYFHGRTGGGPKPDQKPSIIRDDKTGTTTYDILLPWADYGVAPGTAPAFGLTVQVNDTNDGPKQQRLYFGQGAEGAPRPGLFQRIAIGNPPAPVQSIAFPQTSVWEPGGSAEAIVALAGTPDLEIRAKLGDLEKSARVPAQSPGSGIIRYRVRARVGELPPAGTAGLPFSVTLLGPGNQPLTTAQASITAPGLVVQELDRELHHLASAATDDLLAGHFRAIRAIFADDWNKALQRTDTNPEMAAECAAHARTALEHLRNQPQTHTADYFLKLGRRGLLRTLVSSRDRGLGFSLVSLPPNYDPAKRYPVIVYLHGHGDPHPLAFVAGALVPLGDKPADSSADKEPAIRLMPWGRGNYGYHDVVDSEVTDAIADAQRTFSTDPDRIYLMGHSMGGAGTWGIGLRNPDRFAALAICSGGTWGMPAGHGFGANVAHLPIMIWHGNADGAVSVDEAYTMQRELQAYGNNPAMRIIPGRGHGMQPADTDSVERWLLQQPRRTRPAQFTYKVESYGYSEAYGIRIDYDANRNQHPEFTCRVDGNTLYITSPDAQKLTINTGQGGLALQGDITLFVNAVERYHGPTTTIDVDLTPTK